MPTEHARRQHPGTGRARTPRALNLCALACIALGLSACGGGSSSTVSAHAGASHTSTATHPPAAAARTTALKRCLRRHGVTASAPTGAASGGPAAARYRSALHSCTAAPAPSPAHGQLATPAYRTALRAFAACVRRHGVPLPAPNTTGRGPVFSARGVDIRTSRFREAIAGCRGLLPRAAHG